MSIAPPTPNTIVSLFPLIVITPAWLIACRHWCTQRIDTCCHHYNVVSIARIDPWLEIPMFGSDFWDPHWKQNSDTVFDSGDSGWIFFWIPLLKNWQIGISILKFGIPKKNWRRNSVHLISYQINGCHHTYIYSMPVAAIPTSSQCLSCHTYIYSTPVPPHLHLLNTCPAIPKSTQCLSRHTYIYSTPVAAISKKEGRNIFRFMKLKESMAGEDSEPAGMCSKLAGTHFTIRKIKLRWKFQSSKGPEWE